MFRAAFYKGTRPGLQGLYSRLVRWWTRSIYSHCELVFVGEWAGSSSFIDGGVRFKVIDFDPERWDMIDLRGDREAAAMQWFLAHRGAKYDVFGNLQFIFSRIADDKQRWFCSEAVAAALGIPDPWRYDPGTLASTLKFIDQPASAGFSIVGRK